MGFWKPKAGPEAQSHASPWPLFRHLNPTKMQLKHLKTQKATHFRRYKPQACSSLKHFWSRNPWSNAILNATIPPPQFSQQFYLGDVFIPVLLCYKM